MNTRALDHDSPGYVDATSSLRITFATPRDSRTGEWLRDTTPPEAIARVGLAYAICRHAQQAAARLAIEAACGTDHGAQDASSAQRVHDEWLREHACNLMLSWPKLLGHPEEPELPRVFMCAGQRTPASRQAWADILQCEVLGMPAADFLAMDAPALDAWCTDAGTKTAARFRAWRGNPACHDTTPPPMLPRLCDWDAPMASMLAAHMREEPDFCLRPHWQGRSPETGAYVRQHAHPLLRAWLGISGNDPAARMLARLVELAAAANGQFGAMTLRAWELDAGEGLAAVETSRGPLLHLVRVQHGRIVAYHVLAPTEWNFHPRGLLSRVATMRDRTRLETSIQAWVVALDPCETCRVEVLHA